jgi:hypothetical protein
MKKKFLQSLLLLLGLIALLIALKIADSKTGIFSALSDRLYTLLMG